MHQSGAMIASTFTEFEGLFSLSHALHHRTVSGKRLAAVCNAGFESVGLADNILGEDFTMEMASLAAETRARLSEILQRTNLDALVEVKNPMDLTPMATEEVYESIVEALLEDGNVDAIVAGVTPLAPLLRTLPEEMAAGDPAGEGRNIHQRLARQANRFDKPLVAVIDGGSLYDPLARAFEQASLPVFRSSDQAMWILGKYIDGRLHAQKLRSAASDTDYPL
jgi:acyl-CoA synthetase (NDP forming)